MQVCTLRPGVVPALHCTTLHCHGHPVWKVGCHIHFWNRLLGLFLLVGVLGGFTTFSTFAYESLALAQESQYLRVMLNVVGQVVIGFSAAWLGLLIARFL